MSCCILHLLFSLSERGNWSVYVWILHEKRNPIFRIPVSSIDILKLRVVELGIEAVFS